MTDRDKAKLPSSVRVFYRWANANGSFTTESESMRFVHNAMVVRRENIQRPFSYRVEGGDDRSMPWRRVEVVEPPAIHRSPSSWSRQRIPAGPRKWRSGISARTGRDPVRDPRHGD